MSRPKLKKVAYLFGAGATHAELANLGDALLDERTGLLISNVSARVIEKARKSKDYLKNIEMVSSAKGSLNIEMLISLIENSKIDRWEAKTSRLKQLVRKDIEGILTKKRTDQFYLHKALLKLHKNKATQATEKLIGLISLNYDDVLDQAYEEFYGEPNYCFSPEEEALASRKIPLLKLHGSFNWRDKRIRGRTRTIEIIPLGSSKNYMYAPYNFIWNRAFEVLTECDTLRVIGCSLSPNDAHLIDLFFKAHLEKGAAFDIEIISSARTFEAIKGNYGFFPKIRKLTEIEPALVAELDPPNPFKTWLKSKAEKVLNKGISHLKYLKKLAV
jgi:hypothetical protein